jgi:hypothetical protein
MCVRASKARRREPDVVNTMVPLEVFRKVRAQRREERRQRIQAEDEREALKTTLANVLDGLRNGESGKE